MTYNFELSLVLAYSKNTSFLGGTPSLESFGAKKTKSWPYPVEENLFAVKEQAERVRAMHVGAATYFPSTIPHLSTWCFCVTHP